ncbi:MAG: hypothetical protein LBC19_12285 [Tannerella sp.]|jgi:hypothetical protein|nr:hypothetical protein [Tannerella sp.]
MGTGIMGAIPVSFRFSSEPWGLESDMRNNKKKFTKHAPKDFFDFYNEIQKRVTDNNGKEKESTYYEIKPEILLPNFKDFFCEFHELIADEEKTKGYEKFNDTYDAVAASNDLSKFMAYFDDGTGYPPMDFPYFEPMYVSDCWNLFVYQGSYKAILEEWSTLSHMERLVWAAIKNPLAKVMRFGMSL